MKASDYQISSDLFKLHNTNVALHDEALKTKPVGYFKDALYRFTRNKASIVATVIIGILVLFAIVVPFCTPYKVEDQDEYFAFALPKNELCADLGWDFWDGCSVETMSEQQYLLYKAIGEETGYSPVKKLISETTEKYMGTVYTSYKVRVDSYAKVGVKFKNVTEEEYQNIQKYQDETGIQVILPMTDSSKRPSVVQDARDASYWFATETVKGKTVAVLDENGNFTNIYKAYDGTDGYTSTVRVEDGIQYNYSEISETGRKIRIDYNKYYTYYHQYVLHDNIKKASFFLGATNAGKDQLTCLANGARFSFIMAIVVSAVNLFVGAIIGAIEGYYGGVVDIILERIMDILGSIPFMVVISLLRIKLKASQILILFIAFFATGWMGMAGRTRMQFYRFKNQEYVLVSRTLGAKDFRVMFKHIFPNAIGTLITGSVLSIPSVIFSETSLSYLGIINLESGGITSVGTLLSKGQNYLFTYPHLVLWPSIFISLLMLSFNLFGNGLRDAFNPSLRGSED